MKQILTEQQVSHFTKHGSIEIEGIPFESKAIFGRTVKYEEGRDLWRQDPYLLEFLTRKLAPMAFGLTCKDQLRLAFDQWIPKDYRFEKAAPLKEFFSVQGLILGVIICETPSHVKAPSLGLLPLTTKAENILFFHPRLIVNWPKLPPMTNIYLVAYALPTSVYVQNPHDPCTNLLKHLHYSVGDHLKNKHHPLMVKN